MCLAGKELITVVLIERSSRPAASAWRPSIIRTLNLSFDASSLPASVERQMRRRVGALFTCDDESGLGINTASDSDGGERS